MKFGIVEVSSSNRQGFFESSTPRLCEEILAKLKDQSKEWLDANGKTRCRNNW